MTEDRDVFPFLGWIILAAAEATEVADAAEATERTSSHDAT